MSKKILGFLFPLLASAFSATLLIFAFPKIDIEWLAWVALVPLFIAMYGRSPGYGFLLSFIWGVITIATLFHWIFEVRSYTLFHHVQVISYVAILIGFFGLAANFLARRLGASAALFATPFLWVSVEYLRSNLDFLSFPWALLAYSQHQNKVIIQFASLSGAYSVSFLVVMVNVSLAALILTLFYRSNRTGPALCPPPSVRATAIMIATTAVLVGLALTYGHIALNKPIEKKRIKVSVIQANIPQEKKWDPKYADFIMQRYSDLTREASKNKPDLIVWPEGATPGFVLKKLSLMNQMVTLTKQVKTHLLIGSTEYPKFETDPVKPIRAGNTAVYFSPHGKVLGQYLKIRLVPFAEYIPLEGIVDWPDFIVPDINVSYEVPGEEYTVFELGDARFGVPICWETHFPKIIREFVRNGANFILNIANEGRYGETAAPYHMLSMSLFRAVENGVCIARATNTGISCFIDPFGRIFGKVQDNGKETYIKGHLTKEIPLASKKTFYNTYGYVFIYIILVITALMMVLSFIRIKSW